ncbi:hypothetical protein LX36DRAFT_256975 [Colletotrichum falcatum]|nr:hypothetical protein LX36DRAFT_256975 [Colletotrichum falcatum]
MTTLFILQSRRNLTPKCWMRRRSVPELSCCPPPPPVPFSRTHDKPCRASPAGLPPSRIGVSYPPPLPVLLFTRLLLGFDRCSSPS